MNAPFLVRRVEPADWKRWSATRLRALADSPSAFGSTLEREQAFHDDVWIERTRLASAGRVSAAFIAEVGPEDPFLGMVGMITFDSPPGACELVSMWSAPEARGHGVGTALVEAGLGWASEQGMDTVGLWVTRGNDRAQRLYERCGFEVTGDIVARPSDPCVDEVRMVRRSS